MAGDEAALSIVVRCLLKVALPLSINKSTSFCTGFVPLHLVLYAIISQISCFLKAFYSFGRIA